MPGKNGASHEMHLMGLNAKFKPDFFIFSPMDDLYLTEGV